MSYLDPLGGHTSSGDRSSPTGGDGRDERFGARHDGAAPDPYADPRLAAGVPDDPDVPPPFGYDSADRPYSYGPAPAPGPAYDAPDPYAAYRHLGDGAADGEPALGDDEAAALGNGAGAYPMETGRIDGPVWDSPTAATSTSQAEYDLAAASRGPGRRRAGRGGSTAEAAAPPRTGRAGRNLRAAIVVGCSLGAVILAALFIWPPAFPAVIVVAAAVGIWEMTRALRVSGANPPLVPLLAGGLLMIGSAWYAGSDGLTLGLLVTIAASVLWRVADGGHHVRRDLTAIVLISVYVPFLLGFGVLLDAPDDGNFRILATLLAVVLSDTGGYAAGVFLGKHPMAPKISPKKSWEGFGGSVVAAALGSALVLFLTLDVPVYWGALFGVVIAIVAVLGDLTESMMKRDLGIKDMSQLLPGHGGLMDRLDSILFAVPTAYVLLSLFASSTG